MKKPNPKAIGERSEAVILARLLLNGEVVLQPFGDNQRYDLVVERDGTFLRIQCKTGRLHDEVIIFACASIANGKDRRDYRGQIDMFGVYCPELDTVYLVPVNDVPTNAARLRVTKSSKYGSKSNIRWAVDYLLK